MQFLASARCLPVQFAMRVLEARFHPRRKDQPEVVTVGFLVWRRQGWRERPVFQPVQMAAPGPVLSKLRYFVAVTAPDSYERLQTLRSEFWSFVRVAANEATLRRPD